MSTKPYVIAGPARIGNIFGSFGHDVPEDRYAVVTDGEYSNGGYGPSAALSRLFNSLERAERVCVTLSARPDAWEADVLAEAGSLPDDWREYTSYRPRVVGR